MYVTIPKHMHTNIYLCFFLSLYIYIYIYRERERDGERVTLDYYGTLGNIRVPL